MNESLLSPGGVLAIYCVLVMLASLAGGGLPGLLRLSHARLQVAVSFVAGLMLGLSVLHMLPHGVEALESTSKGAGWMMAGFLVMFFLQRFLPFHHHDVAENQPHADCGHAHHTGEPYASHLGWLGVALGLSLHSIFDGLALAAAVVSDEHGATAALGLGTALAVILHKPFGAMAIITLMSASRSPRRWLLLVNIAFALVTPIGAMLFFLGAGHLAHENPQWLGAALTFCAGTFLCIACADLLPELQFHSHDRIKLSVALLAGIGVAVVIGMFGHAEHAHEHDEASEAQLPRRQIQAGFQSSLGLIGGHTYGLHRGHTG